MPVETTRVRPRECHPPKDARETPEGERSGPSLLAGSDFPERRQMRAIPVTFTTCPFITAAIFKKRLNEPKSLTSASCRISSRKYVPAYDSRRSTASSGFLVNRRKHPDREQPQRVDRETKLFSSERKHTPLDYVSGEQHLARRHDVRPVARA